MRLSIALSVTAAIATVALAGTASAVTRSDMTDSAYVELARCSGIARSTGGDASKFDSVLDAQSGYRSPAVLDRADTAREDAKRNADHAGSDDKARFVQERDGQCVSLLQ
jgi:hypothetical protein